LPKRKRAVGLETVRAERRKGSSCGRSKILAKEARRILGENSVEVPSEQGTNWMYTTREGLASVGEHNCFRGRHEGLWKSIL